MRERRAGLVDRIAEGHRSRTLEAVVATMAVHNPEEVVDHIPEQEAAVRTLEEVGHIQWGRHRRVPWREAFAILVADLEPSLGRRSLHKREVEHP